MQWGNRIVRVLGAGAVLFAATPAVAIGASPLEAPVAAPTCTLSDPILLPGGSLPSSSQLGMSATTNRYGGGPAFVGQSDGLTSRRAFAVTVANTTSGTAARTLYDVTDVTFGAYLVPNIRGFAAREAIWSGTDGAWVTQTGFPTGWLGRNPVPVGSTLEVFDSGVYNTATANYDLGAALTAATTADDLAPQIPLTGTYTGPDAGWTLSYAWDNTAGKQPVLSREVAAEIAPGASALISYGLAQERPVNTGDYAYNLLTASTARICLPAPTVDGWAVPSIDGLGTITGTGTYAGDRIDVTDAAGTVIGTVIVSADLTWSLDLAGPLAAGSHLFTATETDVAWSTDAEPLTGTSAPADHPVGTPALTATITDADGQTSPAAPRIRTTADGYQLTFTVANTGSAVATSVTLGAITVDGVTVDNVSCSPEVTAGTPTLKPGEKATCTGDLSTLPAGDTVTVAIHPTATSPVIDGTLAADAVYAAVYEVPAGSSGPSTSVPTSDDPTDEPTGTKPTGVTSTSTSTPSGTTGSTDISVDPSSTEVTTSAGSTTTEASEIDTSTPTSTTPVLASTGAGPSAELAVIALLLIAVGFGMTRLARYGKHSH